MTLLQAVGYLFAGVYGNPADLGLLRCALIIGQLFFAGFLVLLLDELMQKGYGLGSGISMFIATNICATVLWKSFSPVSIKTDNGNEFEGAVICLIHFIFTRPMSIPLAFYR